MERYIHPHNDLHRVRNRLCALLLVALLAFVLTSCGDDSAQVDAPVNNAEPPQAEPSLAPTSAPAVPTVPPTVTRIPISAPDQAPAEAPAQAEPSVVVVDEPTPVLIPPTPVPTSPPAPAPTSPPVPTSPPPAAPTSPPAPAPTSPPAPAAAAAGAEILYVRDGVLMAYDPATAQERPLASAVSTFAATADGRTLALVRSSEGLPHDIWLIERDGSNLRQVTADARTEGDLSWAPDGQTLAYASSQRGTPRPLDLMQWSSWCANSEVRLLDSASGQVTPLEPGCEPAFSNDGRRIAFTTPPQQTAYAAEGETAPGETNTIRLVNRQGENGWSFTTAEGYGTESGQLVYAPAWTPDNQAIAYQRFIGYQALVDVNHIEMGSSFQGGGDLLGQGAGWLCDLQFSPASRQMVVVENNFSDAAGGSGYAVWSVQVLVPGQTGQTILPSGPTETAAVVADTLRGATAAAWAPDGSALVVALPAGWQPGSTQAGGTPPFQGQGPGVLWRWQPGSAPTPLAIDNVDFASPLLWLPGV